MNDDPPDRIGDAGDASDSFNVPKGSKAPDAQNVSTQAIGEAFDAPAFLKTVTERPGVYRMFNTANDIIYVGKASNLKNRLSSYFQKNVDRAKTRVLVSHIADVQVTVTASAGEALLLEHNLIKEHF